MGNLGAIRKLQGKIKRCEIRDQGLGKEERELVEALARVRETGASLRVELQASRARLKQANEVMVAEGVRTSVGHSLVLGSIRTMAPKAHAGSELGQELG